jgi:hypothetical protein
LFNIAYKSRARGKDVNGVGGVRDEERNLDDDEALHTLGGAGTGVPKEREVERRVRGL